ncbi:S-Ena type endospore appendage [Neobacillus drentensis]|uniref:S-Ena type endospore appendage n=1 Tax=Neobacillus drentensis TaxID=220684 RepID=UPI00300040C2
MLRLKKIMCMKNHDHHENINPCCFSCCEEKEFITDKLCCDFTVTLTGPDGNANTIFTGDPLIGCNLVASGSIKNCGSDILGVEFVRGVAANGTGGTVVRTLIILAGGCATFTVSRFDVIRVASPTVPSTGELCIVQRFPVS